MDRPSPEFAGRRVLILEQGFLKSRRGKPIHGVELFRLLLIEQMVARGVEVTVTAERSWRARLEERFASSGGILGRGLRVVYTPDFGGALPNGLWAAAATARGRYDAVLFGDARRGLIPAMRIASRAHPRARRLLFAHRRPPERFLRATGGLGHDVVAVSAFVAERFRGRVRGRVDVCYGLADAARWFPATEEARAAREGEGVVRFVLVGRLPNISKGWERAVEAFGTMPREVRGRCRLHLASFIEPVEITGPGSEGVVVHEWMEDVPAFLRGMDVMLALSTNETFSQAIVQGMLSGLPVISTGLPVYVEKLDEGGGIVVRTTEEIRDAMVRLAQDPGLRHEMGRAGRATALARYVWDTDRFLRDFLFATPGACARTP